MPSDKKTTSPAIIIIAGFFLPGWGYWLIGEKKRAMLAGGGIILMFLLGVFIAGVRVVSFPGYEDGYRKYGEIHRYVGYAPYVVSTTRPAILPVERTTSDYPNRPMFLVKRLEADGRMTEEKTTDPPVDVQWMLMLSPVSVIGDNIWFLGQMLTGLMCAVTGYIANELARSGLDRSYGRLADIGALYTAVAGMLNLMIIVDCTSRAVRKEHQS